MAKLYICDECSKTIDKSEHVEVTVDFVYNGDGSKGSGWSGYSKHDFCLDCAQRFATCEGFRDAIEKSKEAIRDIRTAVKRSLGGDPK